MSKINLTPELKTRASDVGREMFVQMMIDPDLGMKPDTNLTLGDGSKAEGGVFTPEALIAALAFAWTRGYSEAQGERKPDAATDNMKIAAAQLASIADLIALACTDSRARLEPGELRTLSAKARSIYRELQEKKPC